MDLTGKKIYTCTDKREQGFTKFDFWPTPIDYKFH